MAIFVEAPKIGTTDETAASRSTTNITKTLGEKSKDRGKVKGAAQNSLQSV